jgi:NAD(P)-dependent dehydrogenase (short-subunit alcohol dehydrogenase family)
MLDVVRYTPGATTSQITCPLLVQVAQFDSVAPALPAKRAAGRAPLGQVSTYDIGHFDIYHGDPFEAAVTEQVSFLAEHLLRAEVIPASSAPPRPLAAKAQWDLDGRTVVITGAGRGIGAALAERAVARGARVAIFERDAVAGANTAGRLGPLADFWPVDVTDADSVGHAFADVNQQWGRVDVVVANAGITAFGPTESLDPEVFRRVLDVNLVGAWLTLRAGIPLVRPRAGYLLAVSSIGAHLHSPLQSHYVASKAGLAAAVDAIRVEVRSDGIDVGAAFPNFVASDMMTESLADRAGHRLWADKTTNMLAVDTVADALIAGIERRSSRLPVPATLWPIIAVPALVQSLIDANYDDATVRESARLADPAGWTDPARSSRD